MKTFNKSLIFLFSMFILFSFANLYMAKAEQTYPSYIPEANNNNEINIPKTKTGMTTYSLE
jgi:hypothetical protein